MRFIADLHIHSYLSRATSKDLTLEGLARWAQLKGITVVGTGDFTHPRWLAELREKLVPAEPGLYALRPEIERAVAEEVPAACRAPVRFMLQVEISSIYKRAGKVRKVHNLVYAPDLEMAARIAARLARIGNIESDGRPILGLDSRDLLEIVLESSPDAFLVPAHIWTPWFSALGAMSGFDAIGECFADLADHIFAVETGLSSDPAMNWRLSQLDRYALVSSSDAHSPEKLGREASRFDCELSYHGLRDALRDRDGGFLGTVEFFPEEGKYHFAGHRKCGVVLAPAAARAAGGLCPGCGKPATGGVMSRVEELADRADAARPEGAADFQKFIPLGEVLGEVLGVGAGSKKVREWYRRLLDRVGPELVLLGDAPVEVVGEEGPPLVGEALRRMRAGEVEARAGYDGEYGVVRVFAGEEREKLLGQRSFGFVGGGGLDSSSSLISTPIPDPSTCTSTSTSTRTSTTIRGGVSPGGNAEQQEVVEHGGGPLLVVAGPGTGKTRTVVERIGRLIGDGVSPRAITAISFTRKAAGELGERLVAELGEEGARVGASTFHALALDLLRAFGGEVGLAADFTVLDEAGRRALIGDAGVAEAISLAKARLVAPEDAEIAAAHAAYQESLAAVGAVDFDDLVLLAVRLLESSAAAREAAHDRCRYLFVDEFQDINPAQYRLVRLLAPPENAPELVAVGDPDQAIYGFRGSDPAFFRRFADDYPGARTVALRICYRCPAPIVSAASSIIACGRSARALEAIAAPPDGPAILSCTAASPEHEADFIAGEIERAIGGTALESSTAEGAGPLAFHDIAVLFRIGAQAAPIEEALSRAGIPTCRAAEPAALTSAEAIAILDGLRAAADRDPRPLGDILAGLAPRRAPAALRRARDHVAALAAPFGGDTRGFLAALPLLSDGGAHLEAAKVALLTLHAAKGLEFSLVIIAGCEEGLLPLDLPGKSVDLEEERRLFYVGMTRARRRLVLTRAARRRLFGRTVEPSASRFLADLRPELVAVRRAARPTRPAVSQQLALL
jgi:DNA helicase II / ATP-dependent DNA helicase PcrA